MPEYVAHPKLPVKAILQCYCCVMIISSGMLMLMVGNANAKFFILKNDYAEHQQ